jgi:hypothetical protein
LIAAELCYTAVRTLAAPTPSSVISITEEYTMDANHQPTPLCGPIPDGLMRVSADIPLEMFEELERSSQRHGVQVHQLIFAALCFAAIQP